MQLNENKFPKGIIWMEKIFDRHDMFRKPRETSKLEDSVEINIGLEKSSKLSWIVKGCSAKERREIEVLIREYKDIFT